MKQWFLILFIIFFTVNVLAIEGRITDSQGKPIDSVLVIYEKKYTFSNYLGFYSIPNVEFSKNVFFIKKGYNSHFINISGKRVIKDYKRDYLGKKYAKGIFNIILWKATKNPSVTAEKKSELLTTPVIKKENKSLSLFKSSKSVLKKKESENLSNLIRKKVLVKGGELAGERSVVRLLGMRGKHTIVIFNDVPLNLPGQEFDISLIPSEIVDSVVIEQTANIFGGLAGSIKIYTKKGNESKALFGKKIGSFGRDFNWSNLEANSPNVRMNLSFSNDFAKNDFKYRDLNKIKKRNNNQKKSKNITLLLSHNFDKRETEYSLFSKDFINFLPGPIGMQQAYYKSNISGKILTNIVNFKQTINSHLIRVFISHHTDKQKYDNSNSKIDYYAIKSEHQYSKTMTKISAQRKKNSLFYEIIFNYNYQNFEYIEFRDGKKTDQTIDKKNKKNIAFLFVTGGTKKFSDKIYLSGEVSSKIEFAKKEYYSNGGKLSLFSTNGMTFSTFLNNNYNHPSFYDRFWRESVLSIGNPDLKPEESVTFGLYCALKKRKAKIEVTFVQTKLKNQISWHRFWNGWKPINIDRSEIRNYQIDIFFKPVSSLEITTFAQRTAAYDKGEYEGKIIPFTPEYYLSINGTFTFSVFSLSVNYNKTGRQWTTRDQFNQNYVKAFDYTNSTLSASKKIGDWNLTLYQKFNNILDRKVVHYGMPQAGFNWETGTNISYFF